MVARCTQAVDEGGGDYAVAADLAPGLEPAIARTDDGAALVAPRDQGEHAVGGSPLERDVADLVDDEQLAALKPLELLVQDVRSCLLRGGDPFAMRSRTPRGGRGGGPRSRARCLGAFPCAGRMSLVFRRGLTMSVFAASSTRLGPSHESRRNYGHPIASCAVR